MYYMLVLLIAAGLGCIPANIAKNKGYSFGLWWLYGWLLFIVAIIHVSFIPDKNVQQALNRAPSPIPSFGQSAAEDLKKYKELLDDGVITQEEFQEKKKKLLEM